METWNQEEASEEEDEEEYWRKSNGIEERKSRSNSGKRRSRQVPEAKEEIDCVDCYKWEFGSEFKYKDFEASGCGS